MFISGILKETLLSTFESTNFFIYSKLESCIGSFSFEATLAKYLLKALAISTSLDTNSLSTFMPRIFSLDLDYLPAPNSLNNFQIELGLSLPSSSFVLYIDCFADFIIVDTLFRNCL